MNGRGILMAIGGMMITAGIGFIAGSKWTEKKLNVKLEDLYSEEYDLLKKNLEKKFEEKEEELKKKYEGCVESTVEETSEKKAEPENPRRKPQPVNPIMDIKRSDGDKPRNNYSDLVENDEFEEPEDGSGRTEPYIIDYDTYFNEQDYTDMPMTYDWQNKTLINDTDGSVVEDVDLVVGWNNLEEFEESDDSLIYIRDDSLKIDYVVEKMDYRL